MGSALAAKLREKFKDPRLVLKALGLDESLLAEARAEAIKLALACPAWPANIAPGWRASNSRGR